MNIKQKREMEKRMVKVADRMEEKWVQKQEQSLKKVREKKKPVCTPPI